MKAKSKDKNKSKAKVEKDFGPTLEAILSAFREGRVAAPLAQVFIKKHRWAERWGTFNQMLVGLAGADDAATYLQWQEMGRQVPAGKHACCYLMQPNKKDIWVDRLDADGNKEPAMIKIITGFFYFAVFDLADTVPIPGWKKPTYEERYPRDDESEFLDSLPLIEVAKAWGIKVGTYGANEGGALGWMRPGQAIAVGVKNWSTWAHELIHEADYRRGNMNAKAGQERTNEIVAELGGAVLLTMLGEETAADWGGAFEYVKSYAKAKDPEGLVKEIRHLVWRISDAISLILETAKGETDVSSDLHQELE